MRLNPRLNSVLKDLSDLEAKNPVLLSSVSEIKIAQKTYGGYDLVVYPVHTRVRVRTDKALNEASLQYMMLVLDVVKDLSLNIDEIDIRAGTVVISCKGGQSLSEVVVGLDIGTSRIRAVIGEISDSGVSSR